MQPPTFFTSFLRGNAIDLSIPVTFTEDRWPDKTSQLAENFPVLIPSYPLSTSDTEIESHKIIVIDLLEEKVIGRKNSWSQPKGVARRGRAVSKERIVIVAKIGPPCSAKVF